MDFEKLVRILELEKSRGYADKAVSGGLDRFLARLPAAEYESLPPPSPSYKALTIEQRTDWIKRVLTSPPPSANKDHVRRYAKPRALRTDDGLIALSGVNSKMVVSMGKLGVGTVRDLLYFFPRRHLDYTRRCRIADLEPGVDQTVIAKVWEAVPKKSFRGMRSTEAIVGDETGTIRVIWFNQPYLARKLLPNTPIALSGKVEIFKGRKVLHSPEYEFIESGDLIHTGRMVPVYALTSGLYQRQVRQIVKDALDLCLPGVRDFLPIETRERLHLIELAEAIRQAHYPDDESRQYAARRRLAFDELFLLQLGVLARKQRREEGLQGIRIDSMTGRLERFLASLPFEFTSAQKRALEEIRGDLLQTRPMNRLLQGDVGSGKTVVATAAMILAVDSGCQAALMAPTEILAQQHFRNICGLLGNSGNGPVDEASGDRNVQSLAGLTVALLTGGTPAGEKRDLRRRVAEGKIDILIGTHALIQGGVSFRNLGLAVIDEQHRFGVAQRLELQQKGTNPHVLVMSATPIPRTLALTLYGELDISLIDELPPGRKPVKTRWLSPGQRQSGYAFVRKQVREGRQAFIICPLVEESETIAARAATAEHQRLAKEVFPDLKLGLLHGRLSSTAKEEVMQQFRDAQIDILVSTSVVEVGVDIPNATVMVIEGAERFGLSQLHQFRGRVWRSSHQGYCLLLSEKPTVEGRERLAIMENTHNGFVLAEEDLKMRGPGEFFGTRQSGLPDLKMARLSDVPLLETARAEARRLFEVDPKLERPEHEELAREVARLWEGTPKTES